MMRVEPLAERAMGLLDRDDALCVLDRGGDFQPIADDPFVFQQRLGTHSRDARHFEVLERAAKRLALLQDRQPRQSRLIDLEDESLEERVIVVNGEAVLAVVIRAVKRMSRRNVAVAHGVVPAGEALEADVMLPTMRLSKVAARP